MLKLYSVSKSDDELRRSMYFMYKNGQVSLD